MKVQVIVKTGSRTEAVEKIRENTYKVSVKEKPVMGKANIAVVKILSDYFKVPQSRIKLKTGRTSKVKMFEIN